MMCSMSKVNMQRVRNGTLSREDRLRIVEQAAVLSQSPMFVDDASSRTMAEIAAGARRIKRREGSLGLVVVDYLQLIEPDYSKDVRQEQVAKIARRLKGLAKDLDCPVLCVAQLNRQAEDAKDHRPRLSHLRESGAIEQDADVVLFVHREEYYLRGQAKDEWAGRAEIIIGKQRNGPVGEVELRWEKEYARFQNLAPDRLEECSGYDQSFESFNNR
jgi:replicative DNA helicase